MTMPMPILMPILILMLPVQRWWRQVRMRGMQVLLLGRRWRASRLR